MFDFQSEYFRKKVAFFGVLCIGAGLLTVWFLTFDFPRVDVVSELIKTKEDFSQDLEAQRALRDRSLQLLHESKSEFTGTPGQNEIREEREIDQRAEKRGVDMQLVNIVFKEEETWLYLNIKNENPARLLLRSSPQSQIKIVQDGQDQEEIYTLQLLDYPLPDIIEPQAETLGALHFGAVDPNRPFVFFIGGVMLEGEGEHFNFVFQIE